MTKREQKKLDATANALRELVVYASALPCADATAPAFVAVSNALDVLRELDAAKPQAKRERCHVWRFWYAVAMGVRMTDDSWGWPLVCAPEYRGWKRGKLVIRSGGNTQCPVEWRNAA